MNKKVTTLVEQKEKPFIYVREEVSELEDDQVLMKRFASGESVQKQVHFQGDSPQLVGQNQVLIAARVRRRSIFI